LLQPTRFEALYFFVIPRALRPEESAVFFPLASFSSISERNPVMRIAAIYDIHANLSALEAVLQEIRHAEVDHIVIGGDVLPGSVAA